MKSGRCCNYLQLTIPFFVVSCTSIDYSPCLPAAHRGQHNESVDNSREAIVAAIEAEIPFIELDVRRTNSDELILFHDRTLTTSNFEGDSELRGRPPENLSPLQRKQSRACRGGFCSPILELYEAIKIIEPTRSRILVDLKSETPETIDRVVLTALATNTSDKLVIQCQSLDSLRYIRAKYPGIKVLARIHDIKDLPFAVALKPFIVQLDRKDVTPENLETIKARGSKVLVKSLDELGDNAATWSALDDLGVDVILTDHPTDVARFCNSR